MGISKPGKSVHITVIMLALLLLVLGCTSAQYPDFGWEDTTPLDEYVWRDDGAWTWNIVEEYNYPNVDIYIVNMTSQYWMGVEGDDFATRQIWWHQMGVAVPHEIDDEDHAVLFITGGSNRDPDYIPPKFDLYNTVATQFANDSGVISAYILQVPNQPIVFRDDPLQRSRSEDDIIAYTWRWYIDQTADGNNPPPEVILRMPMTKAAKRGIDTVIAVAEEKAGTSPQRFLASGASKRGWTTWSLAATDQRVVAAAPLVMSLLKFEETLQSHFRAFEGGWSFAFRPYFRENLTLHFTDPIVTDDLFHHEDMFRYRSRLSEIPKLMVSATGDEFFLNQDSHHWWDEMEGEKWIQMCPNAEHALFPHWFRIYSTIMGFWTNFIDGVAMPVVTWARSEGDGNGKVELQTNEPPLAVRGLRSETLPNNTRRDFRLAGEYDPTVIQPIWWRRRNVTEISDTEFEYEEDVVDDEWVGFFIETTFESERGFDMYLTSEVQIIPDTFPVEGCEGDGCYGYLT